MTQRPAFQVQILEKLGAPLMTAVSEVAARQENAGEASQKQQAERVAELLTRAVQVSVGLAGSMELKDSGAQSDDIRLALAAMAGPLVAGQYSLSGKIPGENDIKRMIKALEAVLTFSDNFVPDGALTQRLETMEAGTMPVDENQIGIQYIGALIPVINIIAAFPFGRPENKLVQEVTDRLVARSESIGKTLMGDVAPPVLKHAALGILKALAQIYVACHRHEMERLMAMDEQARNKAAEAAGGVLSMDPVWQAFDVRAGMVEILARGASLGGTQAAGGGVKPVAVDPQPLPAPVQEAPPVVESPPVSPAPPAEPPPQTPDDGNYNPMGFFKPGIGKPSAEDGEEE